MNSVRSLTVAVLIVVATAARAEVGTPFTYQGFLEKPAGTPVGKKTPEMCDFEFALWDDEEVGAPDNQIGPTLSFTGLEAVEVIDGTFTVMLDFGVSAINGEARWLGISVCCPSSCAPITLDPRVELTPAPYSIRASQGVGGPDALNVTPSGDVGIGTATPAAQLDVNGAARTTTLEISGGSRLAQPLPGWGQNGYGQINVPTGVFTAVDAGGDHSLAIRGDGTLVGWGLNGSGQINVPVGVFTAVAAGGYHSLAIRTDGTLVGWGRNFEGQINVPAGTFIAVAAGIYQSLAIASDGTLAGWGYNEHGQTTVPSGTFTSVATGYWHSLGIRSDGTLVGWGDNSFGQINVPAGVFTAVAAGQNHSLELVS